MPKRVGSQILSRWYELRFGPEEAKKLVALPRKQRGIRIAILEAHGPADIDVLFERRLIQNELRKKSRQEPTDDTYLKLFENSLELAKRRLRQALEPQPEELDQAAAEMSATIHPKNREALLEMRETAVAVIAQKHRTAIMLESLKQKEEFLKGMLEELPGDNIMRPDLETELTEVQKALPELEDRYKELYRGVERMKAVVREMEQEAKHEASA